MLANLRFETLEKPIGFDPFWFDDFEYNGRPAAELPIFKPRKYAPRLFYTKERGERNLLLNGLLLVDATPTHVWKRTDQNPPDYEVVLADGRTVFVEVTKGTTEAEERLNNTVHYYKVAVEEWARQDPLVRARIVGWNLCFDIASWMPNSHFRGAFREAQRFITTENLADHERSSAFQLIPDAYPILRAVGCNIICNAHHADGQVTVKVAARSVAGSFGDAATLLGCIQEKIDTALGWPVTPKWLIVYQGLPWKTTDTLRVLRGYVDDISPFERVILCEGRHGLMICAAR